VFGMDSQPPSYNAGTRHDTSGDLAMRMQLLLVALLAFCASAPALAQGKGNPAVKAACRADAERLCHGVQPGGGRMGECLKARISEVSPGCLDAVRASRQGGNR
jgi:hypothetical protein